MLYSEPKHSLKKIEMLRNKHQEGLTDGQGSNDDIETMVSFLQVARRSESSLSDYRYKAKPLVQQMNR